MKDGISDVIVTFVFMAMHIETMFCGDDRPFQSDVFLGETTQLTDVHVISAVIHSFAFLVPRAFARYIFCHPPAPSNHSREHTCTAGLRTGLPSAHTLNISRKFLFSSLGHLNRNRIQFSVQIRSSSSASFFKLTTE